MIYESRMTKILTKNEYFKIILQIWMKDRDNMREIGGSTGGQNPMANRGYTGWCIKI